MDYYINCKSSDGKEDQFKKRNSREELKWRLSGKSELTNE